MTMKQYLEGKGIFKTAISLGWQPDGDYMKFPLYNLDGTPFITPQTTPAYRLSLWNKKRIQIEQAAGRRPPARFLFTPKRPDSAGPNEVYRPLLYTPPGLWEAVKARGGKIVVACGDSDMLTWLENEIKNVTTLFGEGTIPDDLPDILFGAGASIVSYYPDLDTAGTLAAIKLWFVFLDKITPGHELRVYQLPETVNGKPIKDVNDIWQALAFNKEAFRALMGDTAQVKPISGGDLVRRLFAAVKLDDPASRNDFANILKTWQNKGVLDRMRLFKSFEGVLAEIAAAGFEVAPKQAALDDAPTQHKDGVTPAGLWDAIEFALGSMGLGEIKYQSNGWSKNIRCPFKAHEHDNSAPAFAIHKDTGSWKCPKCGATGGWKQLAQHIGIDTTEFTRPKIQGYVPDYDKPPEYIPPRNAGEPPPASVPTGKDQARKFKVITAAEMAADAAVRAKAFAADPKKIRGAHLMKSLRAGDPSEFDRVLKGLRPKTILGIIGRTGSGKSTLALQMALKAAEGGLETAILSPENEPEMLYDRALCHLYGVNWNDVYTGEYEDMAGLVNKYLEIATGRPGFTLLDEGLPTIEGLHSFVLDSLAGSNPLKVLIVDSIQNLLAKNAKSEYHRYELVMTGLQDIARRGVSVILTTQANRGPSDRRNKWPLLADSFGGSTIEFTIKQAISIWRPYYDFETGEIDQHQIDDITDDLTGRGLVNQVTADTTIFRILKDRYAPTMGGMLAFDFIRTEGYGFFERPRGYGGPVYLPPPVNKLAILNEV